MKKLGYIQAVTAKGNLYFYVRRSFRDKKDPSKVKKKNVLKLGKSDEAEKKLLNWIENVEELPSELSGFSSEDLSEWLAYVRAKVS